LLSVFLRSKAKKREWVSGERWSAETALVLLEDFFLSESAESFASKLHGWAYYFVEFFFNGFPFYGFSADSSGEQSSF